MITYFAAVSFLILSSEAYVKSNCVTRRPPRDTIAEFAYNFIGAFIAPVIVVALFFWGFFAFSWWVPLLAVAGCSFAISKIFSQLMSDYSTAFVLAAFPAGVLCATYSVFLTL